MRVGASASAWGCGGGGGGDGGAGGWGSTRSEQSERVVTEVLSIGHFEVVFFSSPPLLFSPLLSLSVFLSLSPSASDVRCAARFRTG